MKPTIDKNQTFEHYEINTIYEITINPDNKHQFPYNDLRIKKCREIVKLIMEKNTWDYHLKTELSEPHYGGDSYISRVHFHGVIKFNTNEEIKYFLTTQINHLMKITNICINAFRPQEWLEYIKKQQHLFSKQEKQIANISIKHMLDPPKA